MSKKVLNSTIGAAIATGLALATPAPAVASDLGKALIGGIILCGMTNCANQNKTRRSSGGGGSRPAPRVNETVRTDQQALNYFGYNVGTADGVSGQKTRNGISQYQSYMGYPVTGRLDDAQRANLHNAYAWAQSGRGAAYAGINGPELLRAYGSEARGGNYCQETGRCQYYGNNHGNNYANNQGTYGNGNMPNIYDANTPNAVPPTNRVVTPVSAPTTQAPNLPSFGAVEDAGASKSMAGFCQNVGFLTSANGGRISDPGAISDPSHALDEQFCGARDYAIAATEQKVSSAGISDAQLDEACGQVVALMEQQIGALDTQSPDDVTISAGQLAQSAGWQKDVMLQTGEICLGYGYRTDDAHMVLASSMLLVGAGSTPYSEVFGHHKRLGFGTSSDLDRANAWYGNTFAALEQGATPAFLPAQSAQRVTIMRAALGSGAAASTADAGAAPSLPAFNLNKN
ncbi:Putative peptidoglycan binding domain-containing protein [Lutimaribacter pacificus]|uniref:Peptidoglycan binding domain-containing protein n=1 Tax=Lutimaribacter pacificus TaxID=391948 RepID=A0A1H0IXC9_9RHOB|nr:peptidoglycan-binding domain-containing protein [Lutimaribacter pacificus]SDO35731.1 Putative peptidoglycan binding domain-containing protein [Lutimaribacter pacificus]SHK16836.1 Putative peptidoglycan binding domain-containing protein [Lutimaribacter pacificus]